MYAHLSLFESKQIYVIKDPLFLILKRSTSIRRNNSALVVSIVLQKHYFTKFTVFVRFLKKKQLISRVLVRSLKIAQFYALQMFKKQNLTHPKAAKLATLSPPGLNSMTSFIYFIYFISMNDICNVSDLMFAIMYADDTCFLINGTDLHKLIKQLNVELNSLCT